MIKERNLMKRIFYLLFLLIPILLVGTAPSTFADEKTLKTEVGITFTEGDHVPSPNQELPYVMPRGQPTNQKRLPHTNDRTDNSPIWRGLILLMVGGGLSINKERKRKKEKET